jgi:ABC-type sugar transport system substrate-binding protein
MRSSVQRGLAALIGVVALTAAACGGDNHGASSPATSASGAGGSPAATATSPAGGPTTVAASSDPGTAAKSRVEQYLEAPTSIGITTPLKGVPPKGKKVYWLEGNIQSILPITGGFKEATQALGWNLTVVTYDPADPQGPSAAMRQAVDAGADYIAISGQSTDILGQALDAAKAKNIPVIDMYSTDDVGGNANDIYANVGGTAFSQRSATLLSDWIIADSGGQANVLFVNVPDFKILQIVGDAVGNDFKSACPKCTVKPLNVSIGDMTGGTVASQVVSALQSNSTIDYVYVSIGDLATGLPQALDAAGLGGKVKIVGGVPNTEQVQSLIDGKAAAYTPLGRPESAWAATDVMARLSVGMDPDAAGHALLPSVIWTPNNVPKPAQDYQGSENYQAQFKALWGV